MTTSFGSICFGSLIVAIIQALRQLAHQARQNGDAGILACIAECILGCLESIAEYFNKWAFIYGTNMPTIVVVLVSFCNVLIFSRLFEFVI